MTNSIRAKDPIKYEGPKSTSELAFRWYNPDQKVLGKTMARAAALCGVLLAHAVLAGHRPLRRRDLPAASGITWADEMAAARMKADVMFETLGPARRRLLLLPRSRHRAGRQVAEGVQRQRHGDRQDLREEDGEPRTRSCSGAPPTCSPTAASWRVRPPIPIPDVFAYCAAQVKHCLDVTKDLGGANYVMWGGREGYETLLNTNIGHELKQAKRFLSHGRRVQAQDRLQGPDPDRAEAAGADQAPV